MPTSFQANQLFLFPMSNLEFYAVSTANTIVGKPDKYLIHLWTEILRETFRLETVGAAALLLICFC